MRPHRYLRDNVLARFDDAWRDIYDEGEVTVYSINPAKLDETEKSFNGYLAFGSVKIRDAATVADVRQTLAL